MGLPANMKADQWGKTDQLTSDIYEKIKQPVSEWAVMATIESMGIRALDVPQDFGFDSLMDLSLHIFAQLRHDPDYKSSTSLNSEEKDTGTQYKEESIAVSSYFWVKLKLFLVHYPIGTLNTLPVFVQVFAILIYQYSLWAFIGFNTLQATAVSLGIIISFICTGGFVQVIGRQTSFYWNNKDYPNARKSIVTFTILGFLTVAFVCALVFLVNLFFPLYPQLVLSLVFAYSLLIGLLILLSAPFYSIKQRWVISVAVILGTVLVILLNEWTEMSVYYTHWFGIGLSLVILIGCLIYYFVRWEKKKENNVDVKFRFGAIIYQNYRYFMYGTGLYFFVFTDRILAWSSTKDAVIPYLIWFEPNYEIGMDWGILVFFAVAGVLEYAVVSYSKALNLNQSQFTSLGPKQFNKNFFNLYRQHALILFAVGVLMIILIYLVVASPQGYQSQLGKALDIISVKVYWISSLGYLFLAFGMLNSLYMFTLNKPSIPLDSLLIACLVNVVIGLIFSRLVGYEFASFGLLAGGLTFAVSTFIGTRKFFKNLDYYYYASY